jgi:hypothetical protein
VLFATTESAEAKQTYSQEQQRARLRNGELHGVEVAVSEGVV